MLNADVPANAIALPVENRPHWEQLKPARLRVVHLAPGNMPRVFPRFDPPDYVDDFDADDSGAVEHVIPDNIRNVCADVHGTMTGRFCFRLKQNG